MRVVFVISRCANLGPFIVARDIVNNLVGKVETVDVFYIKQSKDTLVFNTKCSKIRFIDRIDFSQYDIVHSHGFVADVYVFFHNRGGICRHITTMHQRIAPDYAMKFNSLVGYMFERIWCSVIRRKTLVVTLTREMVKYYSGKLKNNAIIFIYNGIDVNNIEDHIPDEERTKILAFKKQYKAIGISARLIFLKGIDQIILSLEHLPDCGLIIIGEGEKRKELEQLAKETGVYERCLFLGYKRNAISYIRHFDVYAMSSRSEGFGLSVLEAASQKIPVICSDLPVYREIFEENDVIRFELENIPSLVEAIQQALVHKESLSKQLYLKYKTSFTAEIMASNYFNIYQKMIIE